MLDAYQKHKTETRHWTFATRSIFIFGLASILVGGFVGIVVSEIGIYALVIIPGILVAIVTITNPDLGLAVFAFITTLQLSEVLIRFHGLPSIAQPIALFLMGVVVLRLIFFQEWPSHWLEPVYLIGFYSFAAFLSIFGADRISIALANFISFFKDMSGGLIVYFLLRRSISFRTVIWALILSGLFMGTISIVQYWTSDFNNLFWGFGGWTSEVSGGISRNRLTGSYSNPNAYSQVMVLIIPLALERMWHEKRYILKILAGISLFVCFLTLMLTFSRGGFLTILLTLGFFVVLFRTRFLPIFTTFIFIVAVVQFIPAGYTERISTILQLSPTRTSPILDDSFQGRMSENIAAWRMFIDNPLTGVGIGNFPENYLEYSRKIGLDSRREARTPASLYLEILSELGLAGSLAFAALLYYVFRSGYQTHLQFLIAGYFHESFMMRGFLAGLFGYLIAAVVKNSAYANVFWILIGIGLGAIQLGYRRIGEKQITALEP